MYLVQPYQNPCVFTSSVYRVWSQLIELVRV